MNPLRLSFPIFSILILLPLLSCMRNSVGIPPSPPPVSVYNVNWTIPSVNQTDLIDGMPSGNGRIVAFTWGNASAGGFDFLINSPLAMATDSTLLSIAKVSVRLTPNPCVNDGPPYYNGSYWNQTHHLEDGSVSLLCGGTGYDDYVANFSLYVDANADVIIVTANARDGTTRFSTTVTLQNIRPGPYNASWYADFHCPKYGQTTPDHQIALSNGIAVYHTNSLAAGDTTFFNNQMILQGLESLLAQFSDPLDGRMFGALVTGTDGNGNPLERATGSNATLVSINPSSSFIIRIDVRLDPFAAGNATVFLTDLVNQSLTGPTLPERTAMNTAWWTDFWQRSYIFINGGAPPIPRQPSPPPDLLAAQYARTRFIQAVQSRGHNVPIKFNGELWAMNRQWGPDSWYQNLREIYYGTMLPAGDYEEMKVFLDWMVSLLPLAIARTNLLLPDESGIFFTEVSDINGLYQGGLYGCNATLDHPPGYPVWLEGKVSGGWTRFDFGGNGHGPLSGLMALDYYWSTQDLTAAQKYIPIATLSLDFYMTHYHNRSSDGKFMLWPSQVLETYWCDYPGWNASDCVTNDLPQIAAVTALVTGLLALPESSGLLTPEQRANYTAFATILPSLPNNGTYFLPADSYPSHRWNVETPELYASHPFRLVTVGRSLTDPSTVPLLKMGIATYYNASVDAGCNVGWCQGLMNTAFLGQANETFGLVWQRAETGPANGYRYPAFAPRFQDSAPSADHYANMMSAMHWMLMQSGEDGSNGTIVLFPAWPCEQDIGFKLWGSFNTSVEVWYTGGRLQYLNVIPSSRVNSIKWSNCVVA